MIYDFTKGGRCSRCGGCCTDFLIITEDEIEAIKTYLRENPDKRVETTMGTVCPFLDVSSRLCRIYPVRPLICRLFLCRKGELHAEKVKRDLMRREGCIYNVSLHRIFFDNPVNDWMSPYIQKDPHG